MTASLAEHPQRASVVVCAYTERRWKDISAGLAALAAQTRQADEVLLVVDHNDALLGRAGVELVGSCPGLRILPSSGPAGLSGARNTGVQASTGDVIAFLDDDAEPDAEWLAHLLAPFDAADVMASGGRATAAWPDARPPWFPEEFDWVVGSAYRGMPTQRSDVRNVIGASMAIRRSAFDAAGLFTDGVGRTSTLPLGCEETELCIRIRRAVPGARVVYTPESLVSHRVSDDRTRLRYFVKRCYAEGQSKDQISALVGAGDATATERAYATRTLPAGVARGFARFLRGDVTGLLRAAAIIVGLAVTTFGFAESRLKRELRTRRT